MLMPTNKQKLIESLESLPTSDSNDRSSDLSERSLFTASADEILIFGDIDGFIYANKSPDPQAGGPQNSSTGTQWYLQNTATGGVDLNVKAIWSEGFTGKGVTVGIVDEGIQYTHYELKANYNANIDADILRNTADGINKYTTDGHGTSVAGVIAAANDGKGTTGVAYDTTITSFRMLGKTGESIDGNNADIIQAIKIGATVDISNNSWGFTSPFGGNSLGAQIDDALQYGVSTGRHGLGTVYVYSAGNGGDVGDNTNYSEMLNSRFTIAVGAVDSNGVLSYFSTPGSSVLVVAPGSNIYTTDMIGNGGFSKGDFTTLNGTSFSAPMVSATVALMLQANPNLGYRDVQEILAYSAIQTDITNASWKINGADNWNGGGLHYSEKYGFGLVDVSAAVHLAETWDTFPAATFANEASFSQTSSLINKSITDLSKITSTITVNSPLEIDHVEIQINMTHQKVGDLVIQLTSPDNTTSILLNRPPSTISYNAAWSFSTTHDWGENALGTWTLTIEDKASGYTGKITDWTLKLYGDADSSNDTYVYTNEFKNFTGAANASHQLLTDVSGHDTINASAITSNSTVNLTPGALSSLAGNTLQISDQTVIENAYTGSGNDVLIGNTADNMLNGGRGNDSLSGNEGHDTLFGKDGNDTLVGGLGNDNLDGGMGGDHYRGFLSGTDHDIIHDGGGVDSIDFVNFQLADVSLWDGIDSDSNGKWDELTIHIGNDFTLSIMDYFNNLNDTLAGAGYIETIAFSDDPVVDFTQVHSLAV
jgi:subtilisin-like proprotein convertase family protein